MKKAMFDFSDNQKNPLMFMMNMMNKENTEEEAASEEASAEADPMELMKQAFEMQMQMMLLAQTLCMMPLQLMQSFLSMLEAGMPDVSEAEASAQEGQKGGFKLGNMEIPPWLLSKLMQIDMSPENLARLQRVLDFVFEAMPQPKDE